MTGPLHSKTGFTEITEEEYILYCYQAFIIVLWSSWIREIHQSCFNISKLAVQFGPRFNHRSIVWTKVEHLNAI